MFWYPKVDAAGAPLPDVTTARQLYLAGTFFGCVGVLIMWAGCCKKQKDEEAPGAQMSQVSTTPAYAQPHFGAPIPSSGSGYGASPAPANYAEPPAHTTSAPGGGEAYYKVY